MRFQSDWPFCTASSAAFEAGRGPACASYGLCVARTAYSSCASSPMAPRPRWSHRTPVALLAAVAALSLIGVPSASAAPGPQCLGVRATRVVSASGVTPPPDGMSSSAPEGRTPSMDGVGTT